MLWGCVPETLGGVLAELVFPVIAETRNKSQRSWTQVKLIGSDTYAKKSTKGFSPSKDSNDSMSIMPPPTTEKSKSLYMFQHSDAMRLNMRQINAVY